MLRLFRKRAKIILWCIIFGVGIPFILWGTGASQRGLASKEYIGEIYGRKVSIAEFFREQLALRVMALLRGQRLPEHNIKSAVWDRILLLEQASRLGLTVSTGEIARAIGSIPVFTSGGNFSVEVYRWYLNNWRISSADFEAMIADSILINKLQTAVISTVLISEAEVRDIYGEDHGKVTIRYALFTPPVIEKDIEVDDDNLRSYYEDKKDGFRTPETVSIAYIIVEAGKPEKISSPTEEEIERFYRENPERFRHARRVMLRQIFVKAPPGGDEKQIEMAESKIREIKSGIEKGKDFAKLARKYSEDKKTASSGGELGYVEAGNLEEKLSGVAFSLEEGEIEGPIETKSGHYFIKIEDIQESGIKKISEARDDIAGIWRKEREIRAAEEADERASRETLSLSLALIDNPVLADLAEEKGLHLRTAGPFSIEEAPDDLSRKIVETAFSMAAGEISDPISIEGSGYAILTVVQKEEERTPPLSEIREKVVEGFITSLAIKTAKEKAEETREGVGQLMEKEGVDFHSACRELGIDTELSPPFPITGSVTGFGFSRDVAVSAFSLPKGKPGAVIETGNGFVFFAPERWIGADFEPLEKNSGLFKQRYLAVKRQVAWIEWIKNAQARAAIKDFSSP